MKEIYNYHDGDRSFSDLSGIRYTHEPISGDWLITGVEESIDLRYMATGDGRRDFAHGQSGRHLGLGPKVCAKELRIDLSDPPPGSYHLQFTGRLPLVDIRDAGGPTFSGAYYGEDRTTSHQFMDSSEKLFTTGDYQGVLRRSAPMVQIVTSGDVVALFPSAIQNLGIAWIQPLGDSPHIPVILPDGRIRSTSDFPAP